MKIPPGFSSIRDRDFSAVARDEWIPYLRQKGLFRPSRLFFELGIPRVRGKGGLLLVDGDAIVVRPNRHGGLLGRFLGDLYLDAERPHRELVLLWSLRRAGIPTLEPIASVTERRGPFFRGYLITEFLPGAIDLLRFLAARGDPKDRMAILRRAGENLRRLHDLGVFHADLQLENLLVREGEVYVIDLDRSRQRPPLPPSLRLKNLLRLLRSAEKAMRAGRISLSPREVLTFWRAYSQGDILLQRELGRSLRLLPLRRLIWRLGWFLEGAL